MSLKQMLCRHDWGQVNQPYINIEGIFVGAKVTKYKKLEIQCLKCGKVKK